MSTAVTPIPKGFHTLTPHIVVSDAKAAAEVAARVEIQKLLRKATAS